MCIRDRVKVVNTYLNLRGFSFGVDDLYIPEEAYKELKNCLLYTSPSPRDRG